MLCNMIKFKYLLHIKFFVVSTLEGKLKALVLKSTYTAIYLLVEASKVLFYTNYSVV